MSSDLDDLLPDLLVLVAADLEVPEADLALSVLAAGLEEDLFMLFLSVLFLSVVSDPLRLLRFWLSLKLLPVVPREAFPDSPEVDEPGWLPNWEVLPIPCADCPALAES